MVGMATHDPCQRSGKEPSVSVLGTRDKKSGYPALKLWAILCFVPLRGTRILLHSRPRYNGLFCEASSCPPIKRSLNVNRNIC